MGKVIETDIFAEFAAAAVRSIPRDLAAGRAQYWIEHQAELAKALHKALVGQFPSEILVPHLIPEYIHKDGTKQKWEVIEDVEPTNFGDDDIEFIPVLEKGEPSVNSDTMRGRATAKNANKGLADAPRLLEVLNQKHRGGGFYVILAGTKLRDSGGGFRVPYLHWRGACWVLGFCWLGHDWSAYGRFPRSK